MDSSDRVVRVLPDIPAVRRRFDYTVPPALNDQISVGSRVRIDLHGRRVAAWVMEEGVSSPEGVVPKPIASSSGDGPPPQLLALAEWAAWRWAGPVSSFLGTASPPRVVRSARRSAGRGSELPDASRDPRMPPLPPPASPGGASVRIVSVAFEHRGAGTVVRLAPALDVTLIVLEVVHRLGPDGVLVLAPSLARATQLADRLTTAGVQVVRMPDQWEEAAEGAGVVIGTRAAAWAPLPGLRAAVILDAHDEAYREERSPTWSAVEVILERARIDRAPVLLVSPCPTVGLLEGRTLVTIGAEVERRGWPVVELIDRTGDDPRTGLFSERLAVMLRSVLDRPEGRAVCILNRTGRARLLACAHCGSLARCTSCGGSMTQAASKGSLLCSRCRSTRPPLCAHCDSTRLKLLRMGVSRATEELSALLGEEAVEVTGSTDAVRLHARLVVGTEAALHRVPRADVVAFLDVDQHLLAPRFGAAEETLALLARASRLVGGRESGGRLTVQTRIPDHGVLSAVIHGEPERSSGPERAIRETLRLPPFEALALLRGAGAEEFAEELRSVDGISVSVPFPDHCLVRASDHLTLCNGLAALHRPPGRLRVEVDPTGV